MVFKKIFSALRVKLSPIWINKIIRISISLLFTSKWKLWLISLFNFKKDKKNPAVLILYYFLYANDFNISVLIKVFGRLLASETPSAERKDEKDGVDGGVTLDTSHEEDIDLKEHMVGILFSRSKLTHLQKQVRVVITPSLHQSLCLEGVRGVKPETMSRISQR